MNKPNQNADVICPFYKGECVSEIHCEGVAKGSKIRICFSTPSNRKEYERRCCQSYFMKCPIAQMQNRIYKEKYDYDLESKTHMR